MSFTRFMEMDPQEMAQMAQEAMSFFGMSRSVGQSTSQTPLYEGSLAWGGATGRKLRDEADEFKERGNKALKSKEYHVAGQLYTKGLEAAIQVCNNEEQLSILFSNRSYVTCMIRENDLALEDAFQCFRLRPQWFKGPWRMMQAFKAKGDHEEAIGMGAGLLTAFAMNKDDYVKCFVEVVHLADNVSNGFKVFTLFGINPQIWNDLLERLVEDNDWTTINTLIQGKEGVEPVHNSFTVENWKLYKLLEWCSEKNWKDWAQRLTVKVLQTGAKKESLEKEGKYPLHAAFRMGMKTGTYELLKHLFLRSIPAADRDRLDQDGNTILHLACSNSYNTKESAIKLLLSHKLETTLKNKAGKLPIELLVKKDRKNYQLLLQDMQERGFDTTLINTTHTGNTSSHTISEVCSDSVCYPQHLSSPLDGTLSTMPGTLSPFTSLLPLDPKSFKANQWTATQVTTWLQQNGLGNIKMDSRGGTKFTGQRLVELKLLQTTQPAIFFHLLHDSLKLSFSQLLRMSHALRQLP